MIVEIKAEGINEEAIKVLTKAVRKLYKPYAAYYVGIDKFELKIGEEE